MSRQITQPVNQVRLTNVAVVRMNRHGKRFEVACYRNKIVNYRQGIETDVAEVLQTDRVFANVSKGQFANSADLEKCFGTSDEEEVCRVILTKGQVQISDMERSAQLESTTREVASMVAAKCVDPRSDRPYTVHQIRDAMSRAEFCVHPTRGVKQQFLDCVRLIKSKGVLPIERAKMELCVVVRGGADRRRKVEEELREAGVVLPRSSEEDDGAAGDDKGDEGEDDSECRLVFLIDPSLYRAVDSVVKSESAAADGVEGWVRLEILRQTVRQEGDVVFSSEMERKEELLRAAGGEHGENGREILRGDNNFHGDRDGIDDEGISALARRTEAAVNIRNGNDKEENQIGEEGDVREALPPPAMSARKSNKKAQKKSKKAKRREKEEAAERQVRIDAEKARQAERQARLGIGTTDEGVPSSSATSNSEGTGTSTSPAGGNDAAAATRSCNTCGGSFTPSEYRAHFRSDWHRYNLKLKMSGTSPVSEEEFRLCDSDAFFD